MIIDIDNTRRHTFASCPRKYFWRWEKNLVSGWGSTALRYGSVIHAGLESFYSQVVTNPSINLEEALPTILPAMRDEWEKESEGFKFIQDYRTLENAVNSVVNYLLHYKTESSYMQIIGVEQKFTLPIPMDRAKKLWSDEVYSAVDRVNFIGRIDGVVNINNGVYVFEHKTTSQSLSVAGKSLQRTAQTIGYTYALKQLFPDSDVMGCMVNMLMTKAQKSRKDGTYGSPTFEYERFPLIYSDPDIEAWLDSMLMRAGQIAECHIRDNFPMEFDSCYPFNSSCQYTNLCQQPVSIHAVQTDNYILHAWDPRT